MKRSLMARNLIAAVGSPTPEIDLVIAGLHSDRTKGSEALFAEIIESQSIPGSHTLVDPDRVIWYMGGDLLLWYDYLVSRGVVELLPLYDQQAWDVMARVQNQETPFEELSMGKIDSLQQGQTVAPLWLILRSSELPGLFLRILPTEMSSRLTFLFAHDLENGLIKPVPQDERPALANQVLKARMPIQISWPEF